MGTLDGYEAFCAAAWPRLVGALAHHTGDRLLAEELAQESLVRAGDRWDRVRTMESPVGWCFRVGANLGASWFRRRGAERRARARHGVVDTPAAPDPVGAAAVRDALALLTPAQRETVVLRHLLGLGVTETATTLGISPTAVRTRDSRGLAVLRDRLGPDLLPADDTTTEAADA